MNRDKQKDPNTLSLSYADRLWQSWQDDPLSVPQAWQDWFAAQGAAGPTAPEYQPSGAASDRELADQNKVDQLIRNYRVRGHRIAHLNPLGDPDQTPPELTLEYYGFGEEDLDRIFSAVLLFAVPHGQLSQPWALIGGHLISAAIGVTCFWLRSTLETVW